MKPGYKTTEFWLTTLGTLFTAAQPIVQQNANASWNAALIAAMAGVYTLSRSYTKGPAGGDATPPAAPQG